MQVDSTERLDRFISSAESTGAVRMVGSITDSKMTSKDKDICAWVGQATDMFAPSAISRSAEINIHKATSLGIWVLPSSIAAKWVQEAAIRHLSSADPLSMFPTTILL